MLRNLQHAEPVPILIEFGSQTAIAGRGIAGRTIVEVLSDELGLLPGLMDA